MHHKPSKQSSLVILDIPGGLNCSSVPRLKRVLHDLSGVRRVVVNPASGKVTVRFNPAEITLSRIRLACSEGGKGGKGNDDKQRERTYSRRIS